MLCPRKELEWVLPHIFPRTNSCAQTFWDRDLTHYCALLGKPQQQNQKPSSLYRFRLTPRRAQAIQTCAFLTQCWHTFGMTTTVTGNSPSTLPRLANPRRQDIPRLPTSPWATPHVSPSVPLDGGCIFHGRQNGIWRTQHNKRARHDYLYDIQYDYW